MLLGGGAGVCEKCPHLSSECPEPAVPQPSRLQWQLVLWGGEWVLSGSGRIGATQLFSLGQLQSLGRSQWVVPQQYYVGILGAGALRGPIRGCPPSPPLGQ